MRLIARVRGFVVLAVTACALRASPVCAQQAPAAPAVTPSAAPSSAPSPSVPPVPESSPSPTPTPTPSAVPLAVGVTRAQILPGATLVVDVSGGAGTIVARSSGPSVDVRYDANARKLSLTGRAPGAATVTVSDDAGENVAIGVLVAPAAGVVPSDVTLDLGGTVSPQFVAAQIQAAIAASAQLRPGAHVVASDATPGTPLQPGDRLEATARVHVDGGGTYVDADGMTSVHLRVDSFAQLDPQLLFYSDDPEKLLANTDGVLFRGGLDPAKTARLYFYHVAYGSTHALYLALRATGTDARVQMLGNAAGPTDAFGYAGHVSTLRYLLARGSGESVVANVTADAPFVQMLGSRALRDGELVAGIFDLRVLSGGPVDVDVIAAGAGVDPTTFLGQPELAGDGHGRRGEFDLVTVPPLALAYASGAADPPPFSIGAPTIPNLRPGGRPLGGDYGVLRNLALQLSNPGATPATIYFYEMPNGGSATTSLWFDGDPRPTELPCVVQPNRYTIKQFDLAPGQTRAVKGEYMTDGASSFPLLFGLTATPPSPPPGPYSPDACNPRTPPPATPVPDAVTPSPVPASPTPTP